MFHEKFRTCHILMEQKSSTQIPHRQHPARSQFGRSIYCFWFILGLLWLYLVHLLTSVLCWFKSGLVWFALAIFGPSIDWWYVCINFEGQSFDQCYILNQCFDPMIWIFQTETFVWKQQTFHHISVRLIIFNCFRVGVVPHGKWEKWTSLISSKHHLNISKVKRSSHMRAICSCCYWRAPLLEHGNLLTINLGIVYNIPLGHGLDGHDLSIEWWRQRQQEFLYSPLPHPQTSLWACQPLRL